MINFIKNLLTLKPKKPVEQPKVEVYHINLEEIKVHTPKPAAKAAAKRAKKAPSPARKTVPVVRKTGKKTGKNA
jgi:hypothetical protein